MASFSTTACPLCRSIAKSHWPEVGIYKCQSCDLLFRYPSSSLEELDILYQTSWEDPGNKVEETGSTSLALARMYVVELIKSLGLKDVKGLCILDYGAGRGALLQALLEVGVDAYGIEPFGYEYLQQNGYKVYRSIEELPKGISFSGIISLEVIEHIPVPWNDYRDLKKFLVKDGWLYVSTPNAGGVNAQFTQKKWREIYKRGHLFFFKPATLEYALRKSGYKNIKRLRWFTNYGRGPLTSIFHWLLQLLMYDGELRYLGFNL